MRRLSHALTAAVAISSAAIAAQSSLFTPSFYWHLGDLRAIYKIDEDIAFSRANMANYKAPRHVYIVDELPVNASGKVLKNHLRARAVGGSPTELKGS